MAEKHNVLDSELYAFIRLLAKLDQAVWRLAGASVPPERGGFHAQRPAPCGFIAAAAGQSAR